MYNSSLIIIINLLIYFTSKKFLGGTGIISFAILLRFIIEKIPIPTAFGYKLIVTLIYEIYKLFSNQSIIKKKKYIKYILTKHIMIQCIAVFWLITNVDTKTCELLNL